MTTLKDISRSHQRAENTPNYWYNENSNSGRYYRIDNTATVADVASGVDIENTAAQVVNYYSPTTKKVEEHKQNDVNSVPVE